jgi:DNA-directed RNA polymerase subunit M/transcription elongation factor TFIIS
LLELKVAARYHKFHSEFLSYSQDDRDKAIWEYLLDRQVCPHCGTREAEWYDEQGRYRPAYVAEFVECPGCVMKGRKEAEPELAEFRGVRVMLMRNEEAT